jgi:hypothetical protein
MAGNGEHGRVASFMDGRMMDDVGVRGMVGLLGKGGMQSKDCRPGVCLSRRPQQREESNF